MSDLLSKVAKSDFSAGLYSALAELEIAVHIHSYSVCILLLNTYFQIFPEEMKFCFRVLLVIFRF